MPHRNQSKTKCRMPQPGQGVGEKSQNDSKVATGEREIGRADSAKEQSKFQFGENAVQRSA